mgnify:CR=1 FL=1
MSGKSPQLSDALKIMDNGRDKEGAKFLRNRAFRPSGPQEVFAFN